jgi:recombination protein RecR
VQYPRPVLHLIEKLTQLPAIGKRSAERIALHILKSEPSLAQELSRAIADAKTKIRNCSRCGFYAEGDLCAICADPRRDSATICVVEGPHDILLLEKTGAFRGVYHALMGKLSPLNKIGPEKLRIDALVQRAKKQKPREIILALGADVESEATAAYATEQLRPLGVAISRIGLGLPVGSALETADELTLTRALESRRKV